MDSWDGSLPSKRHRLDGLASSYHLTRNPHVLDRAEDKKIRSRFAREEEITLQALSSQTYITAVLDGTPRTYPPINILPMRVASSGAAVVAGQSVSENVGLNLMPFTVTGAATEMYDSASNSEQKDC